MGDMTYDECLIALYSAKTKDESVSRRHTPSSPSAEALEYVYMKMLIPFHLHTFHDIYPIPYTLYPIPYTLYPIPYTYSMIRVVLEFEKNVLRDLTVGIG